MVHLTKNLKNVIQWEDISLLERVRKLIDEKREEKGWYGEAFATAFVGLSLLDDRDKRRWKSVLSDIRGKLEEWLSKGGTDGNFSPEYDIVGLALSASFFKNCDDKGNFESAKGIFIKRFEEEINRWKAFKGSKAKPFLHLFKDPFYLYSIILGLKNCDCLGLHTDSLKEILNEQEKRNPSGFPFIETAKMILSDYTPESCEEGLQRMVEVKLGDLKDDEVIPVFWFISNNLKRIREILPQDQRIEVAEKRAGDLFKLLFSVISTPTAYNPHVAELALINSVLGSRSISLLVIPEAELKNQVNEKLKRDRLIDGIIELVSFSFLFTIALFFKSNLVIKVVSMVGFLFFLQIGIINLFRYMGKEIKSPEAMTGLLISSILAIIGALL